jgi:hypothetical protein
MMPQQLDLWGNATPRSTNTLLDEILFALHYRGPYPARQYRCLCPAHDDHHPSLSVRSTENGMILMHCFAGCQTAQIVRALGLTLRDLMPPTPSKATHRAYTTRRASPRQPLAQATAPVHRKSTLGQIVATYDYCDERREFVCQVVRFEPKSFRQRTLCGDQWIWSIHSLRPPLYRLPELLAAPVDEWVFIVEGEKDVEALRQIGLVVTCNIQGAGKWKTHYNQWLAGRRLCILPDNDEAGRQHAQNVSQHLMGVARQLQILELPNLPSKGDASDWLAQGGDRATLLALLYYATSQRLAT